jgi:hypothetical protein
VMLKTNKINFFMMKLFKKKGTILQVPLSFIYNYFDN